MSTDTFWGSRDHSRFRIKITRMKKKIHPDIILHSWHLRVSLQKNCSGLPKHCITIAGLGIRDFWTHVPVNRAQRPWASFTSESKHACNAFSTPLTWVVWCTFLHFSYKKNLWVQWNPLSTTLFKCFVILITLLSLVFSHAVPNKDRNKQKELWQFLTAKPPGFHRTSGVSKSINPYVGDRECFVFSPAQLLSGAALQP